MRQDLCDIAQMFAGVALMFWGTLVVDLPFWCWAGAGLAFLMASENLKANMDEG